MLPPETLTLFQSCLLENNQSKQYFPEEPEQLPRKPKAALAHTGRSAPPVAVCPLSMMIEGPREALVGGPSASRQRGQRKVRLPNKHLGPLDLLLQALGEVSPVTHS